MKTSTTRQAVRSYLDQFERRFVHTDEGVIYLPGETGRGVRLPPREAASLIAGMRATLAEADARTPLSGADAIFATGFVLCLVIMIGAVSGHTRIATALLLPITFGIAAMGPMLGSVRLNVAWRRGLREVERRLEGRERLETHETRRIVAPNWVKPIFLISALLCTAVVAGLMTAAALSPRYVAVEIDRFLSGIIGWMAGSLILLGFAYKAVDAHIRHRVPEADIGRAGRLDGRRPLAAREWDKA